MVFSKSYRQFNEVVQRMLTKIALHFGMIINTITHAKYKSKRLDERVLHESGQYLNIIDSRARDLERRLKELYISDNYEKYRLFLNIEDIKDYISYTTNFLHKLFRDDRVIKKYDELLKKDIENILNNTKYIHVKKPINQVLAVNEQRMNYEKNIIYKNEIRHSVQIKIPLKQLHDIFHNMINNAIKYGKTGTYIKVSDKISSRFYNIYIENIGYNIEESEKDDIFRKGFRGKVTKFLLIDKEEFQESISENKGIGLYYVKQVLKSIMGNVKLIEVSPIGNTGFSKVIFEIKIPKKYTKIRSYYEKNNMDR